MNPYLRTSYRSDAKSWKNEYTFTISDFGGGLNNVEPENLIEDNQSVICKNLRFLNKNVMEKRPGIDYWNEEDYPDVEGKITWLDVFRPYLGEPMIVRATQTELYIGKEKVCDVSGDVCGCTFNGQYYFVDGKELRVFGNDRDADGQIYRDDWVVYKIIEEPIAHTKFPLFGDQIHVIEEGEEFAGFTKLYIDKFPEILSTGSPVYILGSSLGTESNYSGVVTNVVTEVEYGNTYYAVEVLPPVLPPKYNETSYRIRKNTPLFFYNPLDETYTQGEEVYDPEDGYAYYLPCENELADSYAGESYIPDNPNLITVHNNRLFISGDSTQPHGVYMSRTLQPLYFPSNAGLAVNPTGEEILDMFSFDGSLIVGRHSDIFVIYGSTEYQTDSDSAYRVQKMDVQCGFMSRRCGALLNNYYIYLGSDAKFYRLNTPTTLVEYVMTKPIDHKCDIYTQPIGLSKRSKITVNSVSYGNEVYFALNDEVVIVYNYDVMGFTYYDGWDASSLAVFDQRLLIGRSDGKLVHYLDYLFDNQSDKINYQYDMGRNHDYDKGINPYYDLGKSINAEYLSKRYIIYGNLFYKYFKQFLLTSYAFENIESHIIVDIIIDDLIHPLKPLISSEYIQTENPSKYRMGEMHLFKSNYYLADARGRSVQIHAYNNVPGEGMRIYDMNVIYTMRDVR